MTTLISDPESPQAHGKEGCAPEVPKAPGRIHRVLAHEWTLAAVGSVLLAVLMTWPTARHLATTIPQDVYDPLLQAWQIAWGGHALATDPADIWDANAFFPERLSLAYSDSLLGYAPLGMIGSGASAAVARYNVIYVLVHALAFFGAYALTRQLGSRIPGALVAGMAFGYAPWRLAHGGHLNILSTGGIALALAMLARGHGFSLRDGYRAGHPRLGWILAGWAVAAWQITLGFGLGISFGYVLLVIGFIMAMGRLRGHRADASGRVLIGNLSGGALFTVTTALMARPYLHITEMYPDARRTVADLALYSPPLRGMLTAPAESWLWGSSHQEVRATLAAPAEMTLLPGFVLIGLAVIGLGLSAWHPRTRLWLGGATVLAGYLALGTQAWGGGKYGYLFLFRHLPGLDAIRTPGRLVVWVTLLLAVLAAGAVSALCDRMDAIAGEKPDSGRRILVRLAMLAPVLLIGIECFNVTPHPRAPTTPAALLGERGPVLVLPSDMMTDPAVMLWSTNGFPRIVNGSSGFSPASQERIRTVSASFPSAESIDYLRTIGVRTVIVLRDRVPGTRWQGAAYGSVAEFGVDRRDVGTAVVFSW
ncbi:hypothetical protein [Streptomyces colonosanans]|uniref:Glycosyltransferase RgtA/B/C/D-like domain-containing protein n=1 Tax=Streptomyces colonosanans TaxID=1428652 RepID=A0A1S2NVW2_9ACTN|nr:hypothetical protein [Streptomyces colonosanans]OIJ85392.1 hypothetical protein BIV24_28355 [Streptomyces colonosanans]